jgi:hypothetical protein
MRRGIAALTSVFGLLVLGSCLARAQGPYVRPQTSPVSRPPLSPYLNLFRGGNPAINYYGLVRPQQEFGNSIQEIQNEMHTPHTTMTNPASGTNLPVTGHPTRFFGHQGYFFTHLGGGSGNARTGGGTPTPGAISARPGQPAGPQRSGN